MSKNTATPAPTTETAPASGVSNVNNSPEVLNAEKDPEAVRSGVKDESEPKKNNSFLSRMKHAHMNASTPLEFMKSFFLILFHTNTFYVIFLVGFIIIVGIFLGVPIAMIAVGVIHRNNCPAERFIPIWLYVSGALLAFMQLVFLIRSVTKRMKENPPPEHQAVSKSYSCFNILVSLFTFAWFIAGNVWVFRIFEPNVNFPLAFNYCDSRPYYFSFVLIILGYVWMFLVCCCSSCVALVGVRATSDKSKPSGKDSTPDE